MLINDFVVIEMEFMEVLVVVNGFNSVDFVGFLIDLVVVVKILLLMIV